jgi:PAS domain-containing protein
MLELAKVAADAYRRNQLAGTVGILAQSERAMLILDGDKGEIVEANSAAYELFGQPLAGANLNRLVPERYQQAHDTLRRDFMQGLVARPMTAGVEVPAITRDQEEAVVRIGLTPIPTTRLVIAEIDPLGAPVAD